MKQKLFTLLTLALFFCSGAWAVDYYTPTSDEVIYLKAIYNSSKTDAGYSNHSGVKYYSASATFTTDITGDPENDGKATSDKVDAFQIKNNGDAKRVDLLISGCSKVILYHNKKSDRYPQLILTPSSGDGSTLSGNTNVLYNEFTLDGTKSYTIRLQGYTGSATSDLNVYAVKLIKYDAKTIDTQELKSSDAVKVGETTLTLDAATEGYSVSGTTITLSDDQQSVSTPDNVKLVNHITYTDSSTKDEDVDVAFDGTVTEGYYIGTATIGATGYTVKMKKDVTPSISADNVNIAEGATDSGEITFTISNPVGGGAVTAAKKGEADWLTLGAVDNINGKVAFTATANTGVERTATVTLTYTYNTDKTVTKDVTITQAVKTYTITYSPGTNGTGSIAAGVKSHGVAFTLSSQKFYRADYVQTAWATSDGGDKAYEMGGSYTANVAIELFPVWSDAPNVYFYKDATRYSAGTYKNPEGEDAASGDNKNLTSPWTINSGAIEGLTSVVAKGCQYDGKGSYMDAYIKVPTGGDKDSKNITFTIASGYKGTISMKIGGYSSNPTVTLKPIVGDALGDAVAYSGTVGGVATTEDNFNQITWSELAAASYVLTVSGKNAYISEINVTTAANTVTATVGANGYTTFASTMALDLTNSNRPAGLKAYKATRTGSTLTFTALNQTVPAGTGLLLLGETKGGSYDIPVVASGDAVSGNALVGVTTPTAKQSDPSGNYYFVMKKATNAEDPLAFAPLSTSSAVTIPAGKAYVEVPFGDLSAQGLSVNFEDESGDVTGIAEVSSKKAFTGEFYNLNGQKVSQPTKGLYIVNGKKVIIK